MAKSIPSEPKLLHSKREVARQTGLADGTIDAEIEAGRLRITRVRRRTMIHDDDLHTWLNLCRGLSDGGRDAAA